LVTGLIVSWAFDALRHRERLRLAAEAEARDAQSKLVAERENVTRLEERSKIARRLHDSLLQTLKLIMSNSTDADEVRYLAPRAGERAETDDQSVPFTL
jgi:signal transduction histidine kinase